jgi:site-specific DNA-methyltransferase (adenine-specific)
MGSGVCGEVCVKTNRKFVGMEKDEKYFNLSEERIKKL